MSEELNAERALFEERAFARYFLSTIKRNPNVPKPRIAGCLDFAPVNCKTQAEFCRKDEHGRYVEDGLELAWWAWQERERVLAFFSARKAK